LSDACSGRLVRIEKTIGDKVISKSRFYNTFNYLGYVRRKKASKLFQNHGPTTAILRSLSRFCATLQRKTVYFS